MTSSDKLNVIYFATVFIQATGKSNRDLPGKLSRKFSEDFVMQQTWKWPWSTEGEEPVAIDSHQPGRRKYRRRGDTERNWWGPYWPWNSRNVEPNGWWTLDPDVFALRFPDCKRSGFPCVPPGWLVVRGGEQDAITKRWDIRWTVEVINYKVIYLLKFSVCFSLLFVSSIMHVQSN